MAKANRIWANRPKRLLRWVSPLLYAAAYYAMTFTSGVIIGLIQLISTDLYESLVTRRGVIGLFILSGLLGFGGVTALLLKLEGIARPSIGDHLRQSALWYVLGILLLLKSDSPPPPTVVLDTLVGLLPLTAIGANGLVVSAMRLRGTAA